VLDHERRPILRSFEGRSAAGRLSAIHSLSGRLGGHGPVVAAAPGQAQQGFGTVAGDVGCATYLVSVPDATSQRSYGKVFNQVAAEYDRRRPTYPEQLIDLACETAGLERGAAVLEIGCGTGQLTRSLLARGLHVTAIEPGAQLAGLAQQRLSGTGELELVNARFEDALLPHEHFRAVFSASAIHWVDPDVGWQRAADALVPGGTLALVQHFGLDEPRSADDQQALLSAMTAIAPELAASWPRYRDLETTLAGVRERRENISEVWAWLGGTDLAREYAAGLFDDAQIAAEPVLVEHTATELNALLATMSFWSRLSSEQRAAVERAHRTLHEQLGRPLRSSIIACLVAARRGDRRHVAVAEGSAVKGALSAARPCAPARPVRASAGSSR
jgi:SAM-dependent methyltransferase